MDRKQQFRGIFKLELRKAMRRKANIFTFFILPLLLWPMVFGLMDKESVGFTGETYYYYNMDEGSNNVVLGDTLINSLNTMSDVEGSDLYHTDLENIDYTYSNYEDFKSYVRKNGLTPLVFIPANFSQTHSDYLDETDITPKVEVFRLPQDGSFGDTIINNVQWILDTEPFSQSNFEKYVLLDYERISIDADTELENTENSFIIIFLSLYVAIFAPTYFVTGTFTEEREKKTLEGLLVLPQKKSDLIIGKISTGIALSSVYGVLSSVGLAIFAWINNSEWGQDQGAIYFDMNFSKVFAFFLATYVSMSFSIAFGIALVSGFSDQRAAQQVYIFAMVFPAAFIPIIIDIFELGKVLDLSYLLPWLHMNMILEKNLYPNARADIVLFGSVWLDTIFHIAALIAFAILGIIIAARRFEKKDEY